MPATLRPDPRAAPKLALTLALAQLDPVVGDVDGNAALLLDARARSAGAELLVTTELMLCGYPPEDLVLKPALLDRVEAAVARLAAATDDGGPGILLGTPWRIDGRVHNAALLLDGGSIAGVTAKRHLPNYRVFDEARVFQPGPLPEPLVFRGRKLGVPICEDMWFADVCAALAEAGAELLIVPNGSPFEADKGAERARHAAERVAETGLPLIYVNQVGGQDELVFDGASFVLQPGAGGPMPVAPAFAEAVVRVTLADGMLHADPVGTLEPLELLYRALVVGLGDYVRKNGFPGVVLGLSGGVDSALAAAIAVDALGPSQVRAVMMPSPYTSQDSLDDAAECARLLGIRLDTVSIAPAMQAFAQMLEPLAEGRPPGVAEENVQSRARGLTLMALSNKLGPMLLSTGNKSEMAVGYATLYGDMCGGFAVLKDVYKTEVYRLCRWRNQARAPGLLGPGGPVMPERVLTKAPTAELRPGQTDQDSLPPYDELDAILDALVERELGLAETAAEGHDPATVERVWRMLDRAEYKRRQAPPGVKVTRRAFGKERRYPITNRFVDLIGRPAS